MNIGTLRGIACSVGMCGVCFLSPESLALADAVTVPYSGAFDEAVVAAQDGLPAGDFDTIGGLADVGLFELVAGNNTFTGSVWTPGDSTDAILIGIGPLQSIVGASILFGTNLSDFVPMFAFPAPHWTLEESDPTPTIFDLVVGANGLDSPQLVVAPAFERGPGLYSVLIGNGTFGINTGNFDTPVAYTMTFTTIEVPEPSSVMLAAIAAIALASGRRLAVAGTRRVPFSGARQK